MKTLRVCLSSDLPGLHDRNPDYLYFLYDKLFLYSGQNMVDVNFSIVDNIPEGQIPGMIYILNTDGTVHRKVDYTDTIVAEIEDDSQIELLKKAGTMYYVDSNHRYMDSQRRTLTLPYNDGYYELTVAAKNDAKFTNNTILKFNENSQKFEMFGERDEDFIDFSKPFRGKTTNTAKINVDGPRITAMVRISNMVGNILKAASDGLVVKSFGFVDSETFDEWTKYVDDFRKHAQDILDKIDSELSGVEELITPEYIHEEIMTELVQKYPDIDTAIENYQQVADSLSIIENELMTYASSSIYQATNELDEKLERYSNWENLDNSYENFNHECNYYEKAEEYLYPELRKSEYLAIIGIALDKYLNDEIKPSTNKEIIATIAMAKYLSDESETIKMEE